MVEIVHDRESLVELENSWNGLAERFRTPLLGYEWFTACADAFCPPGRLSIVAVRHSGHITALAPLALVPCGPGDRLELLGGSPLGEPSGLIYQDEEALRELADGICSLHKPTVLHRLTSDSAEARILEETCRGRNFLMARPGSGSPWLPIATAWEEFEEQLPPRRRYDLRRARKRALLRGEVQTEILSPKPEEVDGHFEEILRVEAASWKGCAGTAMADHAPIRKFFHLYCRAAARRGILRICLLHIAGRPVAFELGLEYANRFWVLKTGYHEAWAECSPGIVLMHETVAYAFRRRLEAFEFLGSDESWVHLWTRELHSLVTIRSYPFSIGSFLDLMSGIPRRLARAVAIEAASLR